MKMKLNSLNIPTSVPKKEDGDLMCVDNLELQNNSGNGNVIYHIEIF